MLVVGDAEVANQTVALRKRDGSRVNDLPFAQFLAEVQATIARRSPVL
jgi:threonyl-tRNA synthetase